MGPIFTYFSHVQTLSLMGAGIVLACMFYGFYKKADYFSNDVRSEWVTSNGASGKEKRRANRVKCNLLIELLDGDRVVDVGRVLNLSSTGACFAGSLMLKHGQYISVRLPAMRKGPNKMLARVMWRQLTRMSTLYGIQLNPSR